MLRNSLPPTTSSRRVHFVCCLVTQSVPRESKGKTDTTCLFSQQWLCFASKGKVQFVWKNPNHGSVFGVSVSSGFFLHRVVREEATSDRAHRTRMREFSERKHTQHRSEGGNHCINSRVLRVVPIAPRAYQCHRYETTPHEPPARPRKVLFLSLNPLLKDCRYLYSSPGNAFRATCCAQVAEPSKT